MAYMEGKVNRLDTGVRFGSVDEPVEEPARVPDETTGDEGAPMQVAEEVAQTETVEAAGEPAAVLHPVHTGDAPEPRIRLALPLPMPARRGQDPHQGLP